MSIPFLLLLMDITLIASAAWFWSQERTALAVSVIGATAVVGFWQWLLLGVTKSTGQPLRMSNGVRQPHYIQAMLQICLYVYWGLYWDGVALFVPLILVQLVFAYAIDSVLSWTRYHEWRVGFGPVPIVLSINLFLWFREEHFYLQFVLIALTYFCREFLHWTRGGRSTHIFNPSALSLTCVSAVLLMTNRLDLSRGVEIIESLTLPPNVFEVIFLLGIVVQLLYRTTLVTLGAVASQVLLFHVASYFAGAPISRLPIEVSVFLGLTLLVTDPSTSPRTSVGKLLFGMVYGTGTFLAFIALRLVQQPSFVDKIWMVPIVNLMVPGFDRIGTTVSGWATGRNWMPVHRPGRFAWVAAYCSFFLLILTSFKNPVVQSQTLFPPPPAATATPKMLTVQLDNRKYCRESIPEPFEPFGFASEIAAYRRIREVYLFHGLAFRLSLLER
ncbi:MAG: hypothetical protein R3C59_14260 [Planctomycetaceae bacterium]